MVKLRYTNLPPLLVKRRLEKLDAKTLKVEHTYIYVTVISAVGDMTMEKSMKLTDHYRQIGSQWDVQAPRGGVGEADAYQLKSDKCRRLV